jgi:hypothetical protein
VRCAAVVLVGVLAAGCVSPSRTDRDYQLKAANSAKAVASSVATALLGVDAASRGKATGLYLSVLFGSSEKDASSVQSTFDSVQPPSDAADRLRGQVDAVLSEAVSGLSALRIAVRRGELKRLPEVAAALRPTLAQLQQLDQRYA